MTKAKPLQRRPSTPNLASLAQPSYTADPASPPETPTTSPELSRKNSLKPRHQPPFYDFTFSINNDPSIRPVGNGHQFSYRPVVGPEQLSPRSATSSSEAVEDSSDDTSSRIVDVQSLPNRSAAGRFGNVGPNRNGLASEESEADESMGSSGDEADEDNDEEDVEEDEGDNSESEGDGPLAAAAAALFDFILKVEELDPMDSDWDAFDVVEPYEIESTRSRSSSWHARELPGSMMQELRINCSNDSSENEADMNPEELAFLRRQQEIKRRRRVSNASSMGKRTHSERSDSDNEDYGPLDVNDVGSSARRLRKRLHRTSLLFNDPPEQIEELEEPNSDEEQHNEDFWAQELPYFSMEIMEVDSS